MADRMTQLCVQHPRPQPSQSLNIITQHAGRRSPPPASEHQMREKVLNTEGARKLFCSDSSDAPTRHYWCSSCIFCVVFLNVVFHLVRED